MDCHPTNSAADEIPVFCRAAGVQRDHQVGSDGTAAGRLNGKRADRDCTQRARNRNRCGERSAPFSTAMRAKLARLAHPIASPRDGPSARDIRQEARQCRAFLLRVCRTPQDCGWQSARTSVDLLAPGRVTSIAKCALAIAILIPVNAFSVFKKATAIAPRHATPLQGYPVPMNKKIRARTATYRHSSERLLENPILPSSNVNEL